MMQHIIMFIYILNFLRQTFETKCIYIFLYFMFNFYLYTIIVFINIFN